MKKGFVLHNLYKEAKGISMLPFTFVPYSYPSKNFLLIY